METTANSETDRQLAIINNSKMFYDQVINKSFDVETGPLTFGESEWIDQLFTSYDVKRIEVNPTSSDDELSHVTILITDSTCETTDNSDQPNSVKFTWQHTTTCKLSAYQVLVISSLIPTLYHSLNYAVYPYQHGKSHA